MKDKRKCIFIVALGLTIAITLAQVFSTQAQAASNVKISKSKMTMVVGQQKILTVKNTSKSIKWSSSKKSVAKVSSKGFVTAQKEGTATITAKVGKKKYTCKVTVKDKPSLGKQETICVGKKLKLKVEGTAKKVSWSSSDKKVVKVDKKGNIRGIKKGTATITAKVGDKSLKCKVKVKDAVVKVDRTIVVKDVECVTVTYIADKISCKSSNPEIASVALVEEQVSEDYPGYEADLVIYGHKSGTTYVTVTNNCNKQKMKFKVEVRKQNPVTGYDRLLECIVQHGQPDESGNKFLAYNGAKIEYDYWEKSMNFEYSEVTEEATVEWFVMNHVNPKERYIVLWITPKGTAEKQYVTVQADPASYAGEMLVYEEGWFKTPVDDNLQRIANRATQNACKYLNELLKQRLGLTLEDVL